MFACACKRVHTYMGVVTCLQLDARQQTDAGNQATDSVLNLLKPQILLSLFLECAHTHTHTHIHIHTRMHTNTQNPNVASVVYLEYKHTISKLQKL